MNRRAAVRLYTRPNCHLCEMAKREMLAADCAAEYTLEEINIEDDPELVERYGLEIPVVTIDGIEVFKHRLTARQFRQEVRRLSRI